LDNLKFCIDQALSIAQIGLDQINAMSVTSGPGLIGGLIVGIMHAKALSHVTNKPLIYVNHLEGHILTPRLTNDIEYPYIVLLVSGGHTQFVWVQGLGNYHILGQTLDDAVGECFDKTAKLLGLGYPGGPAVERLAKNGDPFKYALPLSMTNKLGADLSFSGLKTATRQLINSLKADDFYDFIPDICASLQHTIARILFLRAQNAINMLDHEVESFVLAGGVAANLYIRSFLERNFAQLGINFIVAPVELCTDNAAMIAWAGVERFQASKLDKLYFLHPNLAL
jgi:N6-L-threonylcarbamoyladenine synthase